MANSYGFNLYLYGCNVTTDIINGTEYYNKKMIGHLGEKFGNVWWTKFQSQIDSIDNATIAIKKQEAKRLSCKKVSKIIADSSFSAWVELLDSSASLAQHFMKKKFLMN